MVVNNPYISLVFVGRNDNYGGDFKQRLEACVNDAFQQLNKHEIRAEILFVNYNPIEDGAKIEDFISWPVSTDLVSVKMISVPSEYHNKIISKGSVKNVPVLEYVAKNVGIRRAKGDYLLLMNPDILVPSSIYQYLAERKLNESSFYRVDRVDYRADMMAISAGSKEMKSSAFKVCLKGFQYEIQGYSNWKLWVLRRFNEFRIFFHLRIIVALRYPFLLIGWKPNPHNAEFRFHCNVSGDFMLMHSDNWLKLKSYPENAYMSLHTDALMVVMAATSGLKEVIFSSPIFHKDHERRYDASQEQVSEYREVYLAFQNKAQTMIRNQNPIVANPDDWGLKNVDLPELVA
ncbi:hypothetical protein N9J52_03795 [Flavobacteriales bacterium]|nr:hypothetical protein [Flavobacteriales bacterium]